MRATTTSVKYGARFPVLTIVYPDISANCVKDFISLSITPNPLSACENSKPLAGIGDFIIE